MTGIGDRARLVISQSGMTAKEFAQRIGLDGPKLSRSLQGDRRFTSLELALIAELAHCSVDWLITGKEPGWSMAARTESAVEEDAIGRAKRFAEFREDLAFLGYRRPWLGSPPRTPSGGWIQDGTYLGDWAADIIGELPQSNEALADRIEAAFGADVAIEPLGSTDGLALSSPDAKLIVAATSQIPARQRFTMAHELGHLLWGDDQELHVDSDVFATARRGSEVRTNAFAASFLMPAKSMSERIEQNGDSPEALASLALDLNVSPRSLGFRLRNLGLISSTKAEDLQKNRSLDAAELVGRSAEIARLAQTSTRRRVPRALLEDSFAAYLAGKATLRPYAALVEQDPESIRTMLEFQPPFPDDA